MSIEQIHPNFVHQLWPQVGHMLERALAFSGGEYSIEHLRMFLSRGEQVLLVAIEGDKIIGAATIEFANFPNARVAFVTAIGGRLIARQDLFDELRQWCRNQGCTRIRGEAREAVARLWKQRFGIPQKCVVVEHEL